MFQLISVIIVIVLVIGGIYSVVQYFNSESKPTTPTPAAKDLEATGTLTTESQVSPQITDSVTLPIGGASNTTTNAVTESAPKAKTKKKRYYYKPKGPKTPKGNKPAARIKGNISESNRIKKQKLAK